MATALKEVYNNEFINHFSALVQEKATSFNATKFKQEVLNEDWEDLKLKERMRRISTVLGRCLKGSYSDQIALLFQLEQECQGFPYLFFPDFVEVYGQNESDWELSMEAIKRFTKGSSSEFAIRTFILKNPIKVMSLMKEWATDENEHIRRLASEGCRPRLPWGQALGLFKVNPGPVLDILELLKNDDSLYVRKSVANNLNDIAKDNPQKIIELVKAWQGQSQQTDWILRKGCRTLIKQADPEIMRLFGYPEVENQINMAEINSQLSELEMGEESEFSYQFTTKGDSDLHVRIEYGIYFIKANGKATRKLFFLSEKNVSGGQTISGRRTHKWKDLTTRKHYAGEHRVVLLLNGVELAETSLFLKG